MDQHLGASITLSFGLVFVFAILLYQPDHSPLPRAGPEVASGTAERPAAAPAASAPALTPAEPLTVQPSPEAIGPEAAEKTPIAAAPKPASAAPVTLPTFVPVAARREVHVVASAEGFTQALDGESLRNVAIRVYGSADETESLWRLNRDLIPRREGRLPAGTLLRTP